MPAQASLAGAFGLIAQKEKRLHLSKRLLIDILIL